MKKTFRLIGLTMMAVVFALNMTACSDDDDTPADPETHDQELVGKWQRNYDDSYYKGTMTWNFNRNGYFETVDSYYDKEDGSKEVFKAGGKWETSGTQLLLTYTYDDEGDVESGAIDPAERYRYSIDANELTMVDGYGSAEVYTRK